MNELKAKWEQQEPPIRYALAGAAALLSLIAVFKVLPELVAAMGVGLFIVALFVPYWLPTIVAFIRSHPSKGAVLAVNGLLGWTFVGWVVSLAWSLSDNSARGGHQTVVVNNHIGMSRAQDTPTMPVPRVGDVMNGHQFTGTAWIPLPPSASAPLSVPAQPARPDTLIPGPPTTA
jgi:hypothetical protein